MIILKEAITGDLCAWFATLTAGIFIQANPQPDSDIEETPRPTGLYGTVNIVTLGSAGATDRVTYTNQVLPDLDLAETIEGHRLLHISINTFRRGAFDLINSLYTKLGFTRTLEHFDLINMGYVRRSGIRDLTIPMGGGREERHQFDLFLHTVASDQDVVTCIETLRITGETGDGTPVVDINLEDVE